VADAMRELRANGYGDRKATTANDYIYEYLYLYRPREKQTRDTRHETRDKTTPPPKKTGG
jgi:hypothetical protein